MVKRQTVWLSTMMVLSLMLIGYYTMNNETGTPAAKSPDTTSVVTPDANGDTNGSSDTAQPTAGKTGQDSGSSAQQNTSAGSADWYVEQQTKLKQDIEKQIDTYSKVLTSNNATEEQLSQAEQQVNLLQSIEGGIDNAHDIIVTKGYKDCVIMPNRDYSKFTVYVKTNKLTTEQAVQIIHIVSEQLNIPAINVSVTAQA